MRSQAGVILTILTYRAVLYNSCAHHDITRQSTLSNLQSRIIRIIEVFWILYVARYVHIEILSEQAGFQDAEEDVFAQ